MSSPRQLLIRLGQRTAGTALRELPRWRKTRWQARRRRDRGARLLFVTGTQRSGTTMLLEVLDKSRETAVYHEYHRAAMDNFRLRPTQVVDSLAERSPARVVVLKPLTESHRVDQLLARFPDAKVIWVFRRYRDVANSAIVKWPGENTEFIDAVREGRLPDLDWRGERVSENTRQAVMRLPRNDLGEPEGASLFWYARNELYFEQGLDEDRRVLLVQYEDLVESPLDEFPRLFRFLGLRFDPSVIADVTSTSARRDPSGPIHPDVQRLCDSMMDRLQEAKQRQASLRQ